MSFKDRNKYQVFLIEILGLKNPEAFFSFGTHFANVEKALGRVPTPWEVVSTFENK